MLRSIHTRLMQTVALSDAEWAPFWISYKALKKRIKELQSRQAAVSVMALASASAPSSADEGGGGGGGGGAAGGGKCDSSSASGGSGGGRAPTPKDLARSVGEVGARLGLGDGMGSIDWWGSGSSSRMMGMYVFVSIDPLSPFSPIRSYSTRRRHYYRWPSSRRSAPRSPRPRSSTSAWSSRWAPASAASGGCCVCVCRHACIDSSSG